LCNPSRAQRVVVPAELGTAGACASRASFCGDETLKPHPGSMCGRGCKAGIYYIQKTWDIEGSEMLTVYRCSLQGSLISLEFRFWQFRRCFKNVRVFTLLHLVFFTNFDWTPLIACYFKKCIKKQKIACFIL
jgi:hypothetical protein